MELHSFLLFLMAAAVIALTPGPGIFYVAARTLANGKADGLAASWGNGLGGFVHVGAGAAGVSALLMASAEAFMILKFAGALYLLWLGIATIRAAGAPLESDTPIIAKGSAFREGVLVEALNPKTAIFFLAFIPQFVDPATGSVALQFVALGSLSVALNTLVDVVVALAASRIREGATARPRLITRLRQASGGAMMALGVGLALAKRPG